MPRAQFNHPLEKINIVKGFPAPRNISSEDAWYDAARKVIPQIPNLRPKRGEPSSRWYLMDTVVTGGSLGFYLQHLDTSERSVLVIDRKFNNIAGV